MDYFIRFVRSLSRLAGIVAVVLVLLAILVVCQMIVLRYFLNASTVWQTEFVTYAIVAATLIGSPYVLLVKGHVNVELLPNLLAPRPRRWLALLAACLGLTFCMVLGWTGTRMWLEAFNAGWRTDTVWALPLWIPYLAMPLGLGLLVLQYLADIASLVTGRTVPGATPATAPESDPGTA